MVRFYWLTLAVFALDHLTKWIVQANLSYQRSIEIIPNYLRIAYVQNSGVAFGLFQSIESAWKPYILAAMAVLAALIIMIYSLRMPATRPLLQVALTMTLGGILGNFADRLARGYVVDFIEFHIGESFHWPTFNVADSAITIGIGLLLIDTFRNPETEPAPPSSSNEIPV